MSKKVINFDENAEKILTALCDAALKGSGMGAYQNVDKLIAMIKELPEETEEAVNE